MWQTSDAYGGLPDTVAGTVASSLPRKYLKPKGMSILTHPPNFWELSIPQ
ncbi:hypothetical protein [uncultured Nostoc sp.]